MFSLKAGKGYCKDEQVTGQQYHLASTWFLMARLSRQDWNPCIQMGLTIRVIDQNFSHYSCWLITFSWVLKIRTESPQWWEEKKVYGCTHSGHVSTSGWCSSKRRALISPSVFYKRTCLSYKRQVLWDPKVFSVRCLGWFIYSLRSTSEASGYKCQYLHWVWVVGES